jgi:hypothetical protein
MCNGFGGFYHKSGKVYFCEPDYDGDCSHSLTTTRLPKGLDENDLIPFEIDNWKAKNFCWDTNNVLAWANGKAKKTCLAKLKEIKPLWAEYEKVHAPAWAEYEKVRDQAWAEYEKVCAQAWAEYEKVCDQARERMIAKLKHIDGYCKEE